MASDVDTITKTIEDRIYDNWTDDPDTRIAWPQESYTPPQSRTWIQVNIVWGMETTLLSKGGRNTLVGVVSINIFGPPKEGLGAVIRSADEVRDMFTRVDDTGSGAHEAIRFQVPSPPVPVPGDEKWTQVNVSCAFTVDET